VIDPGHQGGPPALEGGHGPGHGPELQPQQAEPHLGLGGAAGHRDAAHQPRCVAEVAQGLEPEPARQAAVGQQLVERRMDLGVGGAARELPLGGVEALVRRPALSLELVVVRQVGQGKAADVVEPLGVEPLEPAVVRQALQGLAGQRARQLGVVVELEDAWVAKQRGSGFPDVWVRQRTRYAGGWVIPPRGQAVAPIAPGGATARLRLVARTAKPGVRSQLVVAAGGTQLARVDVADGGWQEIELGPFAWPPGAALVLHGGGPAFPGRVAVDRVEWTWE